MPNVFNVGNVAKRLIWTRMICSRDVAGDVFLHAKCGRHFDLRSAFEPVIQFNFPSSAGLHTSPPKSTSPDRTPESHPIRSNVPRSAKTRAPGLLSSAGRHGVEARAVPEWGIAGTRKHRARTKTFHHPPERLCAIHRRAELLKSFPRQFQDSRGTLLADFGPGGKFRTPSSVRFLGCISAEESH